MCSGFNGQSMQALVKKRAQTIIHKAMACNPALSGKSNAVDAYTKVGSPPRAIGARVALMLVTFIKHLQESGRKAGTQGCFDGTGRHG